MPDVEGPGFIDRCVDWLAGAMDAAGLNGTRLRWKWNKRRRDLGEAGMRAENLARGARVTFKMCPACRALVPRAAWTCSECGEGLSRVRAPGIGRLISNIVPGTTATTGLILLVNGLLFLAMLLVPVEMPGVETGPMFSRLIRFDPYTLVRYGSGFSPLTWEMGDWWRIVVPNFLHGGLLHFVMNSYALVVLGPLVEEEYGTERFFVIYLASGVLGSALSQWPRVVNTVGASGAICGLLGLLLVHGIRRGGAYGHALKSSMGQNTVMMILMSFLPGIDWLCHLGGFLAGFALGWLVPYGPFRSRATAGVWEAMAFVAVALVLGSFYFTVRGGMEGAELLFRSISR